MTVIPGRRNPYGKFKVRVTREGEWTVEQGYGPPIAHGVSSDQDQGEMDARNWVAEEKKNQEIKRKAEIERYETTRRFSIPA